MDRERLREKLARAQGCCLSEVLGLLDGIRRRAVRNAEVSALGPQPPRLALVADMPLNAVRAINPDGLFAAVGEPDAETVPVRPLDRNQVAAGDGLDVLLRLDANSTSDGKQKDPAQSHNSESART